jgi:hypothetical protein
MQQSGITFNSVKTAGYPRQGWPIILKNQQGPDEDGGVINAVDIDWNGAVLKGANLENNTDVTLNNSGQLLKLIEDIQKEIYVLSAAVIALGSN